ncbi:CcdB family protein [Pelotalea chapellei]|uniref:Toxin CcdB n=1 Tax=Pelotalea chapellei TaxID=44671 RepID=A0ABS5U432_9BACT|nr:CcdB family protein [Pelotalea chapellei]MBT1070405.1 CcdB family protein [Pelotalea chapellei]
MAQFDVYRNNGRDSKAIPFVVDIQYDIFADCGSRIVIPLLSAEIARARKMDYIEKANLVFMFGDTELILATQLLAAISVKELRGKVGSIAFMRSDILATVDALLSGF